MNLEKNREVMIENQLRPNKITNSNVLQAFMNTSKEQFISEDKIKKTNVKKNKINKKY